MQANYIQRLRIIFSKVGSTRFIGHLDLARTLERSFNRARIPLAYTQGFNRRPRMQLASALPLGFTSECEIADIWLLEEIDPLVAMEMLVTKLAPGIEVHSVAEVDLKSPSLQTLEATYVVTPSEPQDMTLLQKQVDQLLAAKIVPRERRGKNYDLRPLILSLALGQEDSDEVQLKMRLSLLPGKTGRPDEVLDELGLDPLAARIHRSELLLIDPNEKITSN